MKYTVRVYEVHSFDVEVEAGSADEAREIVSEKLQDSFEGLDAPEYNYTMNVEDWRVERIQ